jgi:hypothetical protein
MQRDIVSDKRGSARAEVQLHGCVRVPPARAREARRGVADARAAAQLPPRSSRRATRSWSAEAKREVIGRTGTRLHLLGIVGLNVRSSGGVGLGRRTRRFRSGRCAVRASERTGSSRHGTRAPSSPWLKPTGLPGSLASRGKGTDVGLALRGLGRVQLRRDSHLVWQGNRRRPRAAWSGNLNAFNSDATLSLLARGPISASLCVVWDAFNADATLTLSGKGPTPASLCVVWNVFSLPRGHARARVAWSSLLGAGSPLRGLGASPVMRAKRAEPLAPT